MGHTLRLFLKIRRMQNATRPQQRSSSAVERTSAYRRALLQGLALVGILGGLAGLNPLIGAAGAVLLLLLPVVWPRPLLVVYGLTLGWPLVRGLPRGGTVPFLRL